MSEGTLTLRNSSVPVAENQYSILIIDDETGIRESLHALCLPLEGYSVESADRWRSGTDGD